MGRGVWRGLSEGKVDYIVFVKHECQRSVIVTAFCKILVCAVHLLRTASSARMFHWTQQTGVWFYSKSSAYSVDKEHVGT